MLINCFDISLPILYLKNVAKHLKNKLNETKPASINSFWNCKSPWESIHQVFSEGNTFYIIFASLIFHWFLLKIDARLWNFYSFHHCHCHKKWAATWLLIKDGFSHPGKKLVKLYLFRFLKRTNSLYPCDIQLHLLCSVTHQVKNSTIIIVSRLSQN